MNAHTVEIVLILWYLTMHTFEYSEYDMIHLSTAVGLTSGGSSTVHIYAQTIHRTTQWNRIHKTEHT